MICILLLRLDDLFIFHIRGHKKNLYINIDFVESEPAGGDRQFIISRNETF